MNPADLKPGIEAALFAAEAPLSCEALMALFDPDLGPVPSSEEVHAALCSLAADCEGRAIELVQVASGWRYQVRQCHARWVQRLYAERPGRYSRAAMETLAIIAYRQPVTRGEVEDIRGVAVSTNIVRTLLEREWVRVVGHREVPGRPAVYATTRQFLDYFGLRSLEQLPSLAELLPPEDALLAATGGESPGAFTSLRDDAEAPAGAAASDASPDPATPLDAAPDLQGGSLGGMGLPTLNAGGSTSEASERSHA